MKSKLLSSIIWFMGGVGWSLCALFVHIPYLICFWVIAIISLLISLIYQIKLYGIIK